MHNIKTSFDFNYRSALWGIDEAIKAYKEIMPFIDVCFGNVYDLKTFLLIDEPNKIKIIKKYFNMYKCSYLIFTNRTVHSKTKNSLNAELYYKESEKIKSIKTKTITFEVLDRIGGGDAFDGGVIHELNKDFQNKEQAINLGIKLDAIKHSICGDILNLNNNEIIKRIKNLG